MPDPGSAAVPLAWGARVSKEFRDAVRNIASLLRVPPDWPMAVMAFESGRTFASGTLNKAGSGAVGLIQFMPSTAAALGTTTDELASMTPVEQLHFVFLYLSRFAGRIETFEDLYMAILWPAAVGKPNDFVLFDRADKRRPKQYIQNAGLDLDKNGQITKGEAASRPRALLVEGLLAKNRLA